MDLGRILGGFLSIFLSFLENADFVKILRFPKEKPSFFMFRALEK